MEMKLKLATILGMLVAIEARGDIRPGSMSEVELPGVINEVRGAIDMATVQEEQAQAAAAPVAPAVAVDLSDVHDKIDKLITDLAAVSNVVDASSDKLDGMEDVLAAFVHQAPAPAEQPAG